MKSINLLDEGLLILALAKAIHPLGGCIAHPITINSDFVHPDIRMELKLTFAPKELHEYIAQSLLPELCKAQTKTRGQQALSGVTKKTLN